MEEDSKGAASRLVDVPDYPKIALGRGSARVPRRRPTEEYGYRLCVSRLLYKLFFWNLLSFFIFIVLCVKGIYVLLCFL